MRGGIPLQIDFDRVLNALEIAAREADFTEVECRLQRISRQIPNGISASELRALSLRKLDLQLQKRTKIQVYKFAEVYAVREKPMFEAVWPSFGLQPKPSLKHTLRHISHSRTISVQSRVNQAICISGNNVIKYVDPLLLCDVQIKIQQIIDRSNSITDCVIAMKSLLIFHPLNDGNGRFSRSIFDSMICRILRINNGISILFPFMYLSKEKFIESYFAIYRFDDGTLFVNLMNKTLKIMCSFMEHVFTEK